MGFELDRLMRQYGVSSPVLSYSGTPIPIAPNAPMKPADITPSTLEGDQGKVQNATRQADYDSLMQKYNADLSAMPTRSAQYAADKVNYPTDRAKYDAYAKQYQDRILNTPEYGQAQFNTFTNTPSTMTTLSPSSMSRGAAGLDAQNRAIQEYFQATPNVTKDQAARYMAQYGLVDRDVRNAMGSGFQYGNGLSGYGSHAQNSAEMRGGEGRPQQQEHLRSWFAQNPNATDAQVQAMQKQWGVEGRDLQAATGNYWGNTLKPPSYNQQTVTPVTKTATNAYMKANPDVWKAFLANPYGMSEDDFAKTHYDRYGKNEQRGSPVIPSLVPTTTIQTPNGPVNTTVTQPTIPSLVTGTPAVVTTPTAQSGAKTAYIKANPSLWEQFQLNNYGMDEATYALTHWNRFGQNQGFIGTPDVTGGTGGVSSPRTETRQEFAGGGRVDTTGEMASLNDLAQNYAVDEVPGSGLNMARVTPDQLRLMQEQDPEAMQLGAARFDRSMGREAPVRADPNEGLAEMLARYQPKSQYQEEARSARESLGQETKAFYDMINGMANAKDGSAPDKSEMYFRLAAAFGSPTKSGKIGEVIGNVSGTMADYQRESKAANRAAAQQKQNLMLQAQQARMTGAKDELTAVRGLAADEAKGQQAVTMEAMKELFKSGQPQSEAGKIAKDEGKVPGTPEYNARVKEVVTEKLESGQYFKQATLALQQSGLDLREDETKRKAELAAAEAKKLSPAEYKLKTETEDKLDAAKDALKAVTQALKLNPDTFDSTLGDKAQRFALENTQSKHPKVVATRTLENLLAEKALSQLKAIFGGMPTEGERKVLMDLQGIGAKSIEERKIIMENAQNMLTTHILRGQKRLTDITSGASRLKTE